MAPRKNASAQPGTTPGTSSSVDTGVTREKLDKSVLDYIDACKAGGQNVKTVIDDLQASWLAAKPDGNAVATLLPYRKLYGVADKPAEPGKSAPAQPTAQPADDLLPRDGDNSTVAGLIATANAVVANYVRFNMPAAEIEATRENFRAQIRTARSASGTTSSGGPTIAKEAYEEAVKVTWHKVTGGKARNLEVGIDGVGRYYFRTVDGKLRYGASYSNDVLLKDGKTEHVDGSLHNLICADGSNVITEATLNGVDLGFAVYLSEHMHTPCLSPDMSRLWARGVRPDEVIVSPKKKFRK